MKITHPSRTASLLVLILLLVCFSINSLAHSGRKAFWRDETNGFTDIKTLQFIPSLISGVRHQGTASPLDYWLAAVVYKLRLPLHYLGLQPHQYFRLHYLAIIWAVSWLGWKICITSPTLSKFTFAPWVYIFCAGFFLFNPTIYYYSAEMRPYSLWASLSFLLLFSRLAAPKTTLLWSLSLLALSLTTTASLFQILSLVVAAACVAWAFGPPLPKTRGLMYLLAVLINLYYLNVSDRYSFSPGTWSQFFEYWLPFLPTLILGLVLSLKFFQSRQSSQLETSLAVVGWLFLGPVSFFFIRAGGFFFDPRQYIYYQSATAVLIFLALNYVFHRAGKSWSVILLTSIVVLLQLRQTNLTLPLQAVRILFHGQPISLPVNYVKLSDRVPAAIPANYHFIPTDQYRLDNQAAAVNTQIWWDYLTENYPPARYPRDAHSQVVFQARGYSFEVKDISTTQ